MSNEWSAKIKDAILSDSALRDGLTDQEAQPLIDWGLARAEEIGSQIAALPAAEIEIVLEEKQYALLKLMTRITWIAIHRAGKGAEWTTATLQKLNELNQTLYGETAPQISDNLIAAYAQQSNGLTQGEMVLELMKQLSPPSQDRSIQPEEKTTEDNYGETPI